MTQTDLDVMRAMLNRAGIVHCDKRFDDDVEGVVHLNIEAQMGPKNDGYSGFFALFTFSNGALDRVTMGE